jgi:hypothetical protein
MLPILPRVFGQILFEVGGRMSYSRVSGLGGFPFFLGFFLFFFVPYKVKEPHKTLNTTLQTLQVSVHKKNHHQCHETHPQKLHRVIGPTQKHTHTSPQTKNLTCKRNSKLALFFGLYSRQQECKLRGLFLSHICNQKKKPRVRLTLYFNHNNS